MSLYDHLVALTNSPVAVAQSGRRHWQSCRTGCRAWQNCREFPQDKRILGYQPYWATLGHLNLRAGNIEPGARRCGSPLDCRPTMPFANIYGGYLG